MVQQSAFYTEFHWNSIDDYPLLYQQFNLYLNRFSQQVKVPRSSAASDSHLHVEMKSSNSFRHQFLLRRHVQLQLIHAASVQLFERLGVVDRIKLVELQAFPCGWQLQSSLCHFSQHLPPRQVTHIASVGMGHQQHRVFLPHLVDAVHVVLGGLRAADLALPIRTVEILQVAGQGFMAVQLCREIQGGELGVVLIPLDLLLHGRVCVVKCNSAKLKGGKKIQMSSSFFSALF